MKIRNDFVTNSSSSSFILGFTSKDKIEEELLEGTTSDLLKDVVLKDVLEAEQFDEKEVENRIREEMKYTAIWRIEELYRRRTGCSYQDASDYVNTDDGKKEVEQYIDNIVNDAAQKIFENEKCVFVEISYSDDYNCELEHYIMPFIPTNIITFNHH